MPKVRKNLTNITSRHFRRLVRNDLLNISPNITNQLSIESVDAESFKLLTIDKLLNEVPDPTINHNHIFDAVNSSTCSSIDNLSIDYISDEFSSIDTNNTNNNTSLINNQFYTHDNNVVLDKKNNFTTMLANWAIQENINHVSVNRLLEVLKSHPCHTNLPNCARTLLNTPRKCNVIAMNPGHYIHFGLKKGVLNSLAKLKILDSNEINIAINIDGLPLSRSLTSSIWPILGCIIPFNIVFIIGAYHGQEKPKNSNEYLKDFVDEAITLINDGILFNEKIYSVCIKQFICDSPAKAFILCVKSHSGYSSCTKCVIEGDYRKNRVCFLETDSVKRTDDDFQSYKDDNNHIQNTILDKIPGVGLVTSVPLDYMHLVCLGVTRKLLYTWLFGDLSVRLPNRNVQIISFCLETFIKPYIPIEFCRKPRSLKYIKQFKATEYRQFLLYSGVLVLKASKLPSQLCDNFVCLHVAITIMCSEIYSKCYLEYAKDLLVHFVKTFTLLYSEHNVSHNVHNLIHLGDDVKIHGILDSFSAFKFENFMQTIKKKFENLISLYNRCIIVIQRSILVKNSIITAILCIHSCIQNIMKVLFNLV